MKTVLFRAPVLTQSGYGQHARQCASWLLKQPDINVKFATLSWGDTPWCLDGTAFDGLAGEVMRRSVPHDHRADVTFQLQLPDEWRPDLAPVNIGITAGVETDRCNPAWLKACDAMTAIVVPSEHTKRSLTNTGPVARPIHVVPEAYAGSIVEPQLPELASFPAPFNFLIVGQLTGGSAESDRKNTFYAIKWLCEAFKDDPDVGIIVKTNSGKNSLIDRQITRNLLKAVVSESRRGAPNPRVQLLHGGMADDEIAALYRHPQVKALVSLTRGEGYGLPILEAAASGLPIIATGWSGHMDFLKHGRFINVFYQLQDIHASRVDERIFMKGSRWAQPSEDDFKRRALKFRQSPATPQEWARDLQTKVIERYSLEAVHAAYDAALGGYLR